MEQSDGRGVATTPPSPLLVDAMEPERKIEKLLRGYAKKRRTDGGDAFKLHPVTRRRLQDEVARQAAKADDAEADISLWQLVRRQWAFLIGFAVIALFGAALFLPELVTAKKKSQTIAAMNNLKQIGMAAQMVAEENNGKLPMSLDALTNGLVSDKLLTDAESGKRFVYVAGGETLDDLPSNAVLAYSPAEKKDRAVLFADGRVEVVKVKEFEEVRNRGESQLVAANEISRRKLGAASSEAPATMTVMNGTAAATSPAAVALATGNAGAARPALSGQKSETDRDKTKLADSDVIARSSGELAINKPAASMANYDLPEKIAAGKDFAGQTSSVQFASTASEKLAFGAQNSFKNIITQTKAAPVLANFQLQQNGNAIRVVDADGSVYDGAVLPESLVTQNEPDPAAMPQSAAVVAPDQPLAKAIARQDESQAAQNYSFRVSGLNQTLKQKVVFTGSLLANSDTTKNTQQKINGSSNFSGFNGSSGGGGGVNGQMPSALNIQQQPIMLLNSRIEGTAVIADTNRIKINAEPLSP